MHLVFVYTQYLGMYLLANCKFSYLRNFQHYYECIAVLVLQDISDLFGCDLPVEGGRGVRFQWRDGPLLRALKTGDWVLLDEVSVHFFYPVFN